METDGREKSVGIIGASPAGLMAGYLLASHGWKVIVFEAGSRVGGKAREFTHHGYILDPVGYRFTAASPEVTPLWQAVLPGGMMERPHLSRIYQRREFYPSPLNPAQTIRKLNLGDYGRCLASWLRMQIRPARENDDFEAWGRNRYGHHFFSLFFDPYIDKIWGDDGREFPADWVDRAAICERTSPRSVPFLYPKRGPGMFWEACARRIVTLGGEIRLGERVSRLLCDTCRRRWLVEAPSGDGGANAEVDHLISAIGVGDLLHSLRPAPEEELFRAADAFRFRDLVLAAVMVPDEDRFAGTHLEVYEPTLRVGRILHYNAWSSAMVPVPGVTSYGLQYFGKAGDACWISRDETLLERAMRELTRLGLAAPGEMVDGCVIRLRDVFAVHDRSQIHADHLIGSHLRRSYPHLHLLGPHVARWDDGQQSAMEAVFRTVESLLNRPISLTPSPPKNKHTIKP